MSENYVKTYVDNYVPGGGGSDLTFDLPVEGFSGVDKLPPTVTINSISVTPMFRHKGGDATLLTFPHWTYGAACPVVSVLTPPTINRGSPICGNANDDSVMINASDYYQCGNTTTGDVATEDMYFEILFKTPLAAMGADGVLFAKQIPGAQGHGVRVAAAGTSVIMGMRDATGSVAHTQTGLALGTWYFLQIYVKRNGSCRMYLHGQYGSVAATDFSTRALTLTNAAAFTIGAYSDGTGPYSGNIAYVAGYKYAAWLDTYDQWKFSGERYALLVGHSPRYCAEDLKYPFAYARTSARTIQRIEGTAVKYYTVGANGFPVNQILDANGTTIHTGVIPDPPATNKMWWSNDLTNAVYTKTNCTIGGSTPGPDRARVLQGVIGDLGGPFEIGPSQPSSGNLTVANWIASCIVRGGSDTIWRLENSTIANGAAWFNSAGAVLSTEAGLLGAGVHYIDGTSWRCWVKFLGTVAPHTIKVCAASANATDTSSGDGATQNIYAGYVQCELAAPTSCNFAWCSSFIYTEGADVARTGDKTDFHASCNVGGISSEQMTIEFDFIKPGGDLIGAATIPLLHVGGGGNDSYVAVGMGQADQKVKSISVGATGAPWGGGSVVGVKTTYSARTKYSYKGYFKRNSFKQFIDGVADGTEDTLCDIPPYCFYISVGQGASADASDMILVKNVKIYKSCP